MTKWIGFGCDTDCDGTTYYAAGVIADDLDTATALLRELCGGMTYDGIYEIVRADAAGFKISTEQSQELWSEPLFEREAGLLFYTTLGADWNPWVYDETIGIPALDTRYDDLEASIA